MARFYLQVQKAANQCLFQLAWNSTQKITAELPYPEEIISLYKNWLNCYHQFYNRELRAKLVGGGIATKTPQDWQAKLVDAEAKLLYRFHTWLRHEALYDICSVLIADNERDRSINHDSQNHLKVRQINYTDIFISCNTPELTRLPWEAWEINSRLTTTRFRISRQPINIQTSLQQVSTNSRKVRVLAVFGDSKGLDFQKEKQALDGVSKQIFVKKLFWESGKDIEQFKYEIVNELKSKPGWDILFFAGHSGDTELTGGEILIAPNAVMTLKEIETPLQNAIAQGLKFAVFNSCDGLSIANKLIGLGLSQVAIMREKIHNRVAEEIFVQFLNGLSQYQDVHQSLLTACEYLKVDRNLTYPSAHLIPSLFRHPDAELFQLQPSGIGTVIKKWLPNSLELGIISILSISSILPPVQNVILDWQVGIQAVYRHLTNRIPKADAVPPVLVVSIDKESLTEANIYGNDFNPIPHKYLAKIIDSVVTNPHQVIGIDYQLDLPDKNSNVLASTIQQKIQKYNALFIFATTLENDLTQEESLSETVSNHSLSMQGFVDKFAGHLALLDQGSDCEQTCPFTYLIALSQSLNQNNSLDKFLRDAKRKPDLLSRTSTNPNLAKQNQTNSNPANPNQNNNLRTELFTYIDNQQKNNDTKNNNLTKPNLTKPNLEKTNLTEKLNQLRLHPLTTLSTYFGQVWLYPIIDYSLPPNQVYQIVSAKDIINQNNINQNNINQNHQTLDQQQIKQQVILIGAGGYGDAGLDKNHSDNFPIPLGVAYWRLRYPYDTDKAVFPGVEINAYMVQHLLKQHLIIPIPDLWMIGIAVLLGKGTQIFIVKHKSKQIQNRKSNQKQWQKSIHPVFISMAGTGIYIFLSMEMYVSASILFPVFLPSVLYCYYVLSAINKKSHA